MINDESKGSSSCQKKTNLFSCNLKVQGKKILLDLSGTIFLFVISFLLVLVGLYAENSVNSNLTDIISENVAIKTVSMLLGVSVLAFGISLYWVPRGAKIIAFLEAPCATGRTICLSSCAVITALDWGFRISGSAERLGSAALGMLTVYFLFNVLEFCVGNLGRDFLEWKKLRRLFAVFFIVTGMCVFYFAMVELK